MRPILKSKNTNKNPRESTMHNINTAKIENSEDFMEISIHTINPEDFYGLEMQLANLLYSDLLFISFMENPEDFVQECNSLLNWFG